MQITFILKRKFISLHVKCDTLLRYNDRQMKETNPTQRSRGTKWKGENRFCAKVRTSDKATQHDIYEFYVWAELHIRNIFQKKKKETRQEKWQWRWQPAATTLSAVAISPNLNVKFNAIVTNWFGCQICNFDTQKKRSFNAHAPRAVLMRVRDREREREKEKKNTLINSMIQIKICLWIWIWESHWPYFAIYQSDYICHQASRPSYNGLI